MSLPTLTLADFLLARIAEDHRTAVVEASLRTDDPYWGSGESSKWERRITPERLLAECEAKRRIVEELSLGWAVGSQSYHEGVSATISVALHLLALPYAHHPDYREEWHVAAS